MEDMSHLWPDTMTTPSPEETIKAARRLFRLFAKAKWKYKIKRAHTWRSLVYLVSVQAHKKLGGKSPHDYAREKLTWAMIKYVIASGWLDGALKPKPRVIKQEKRVGKLTRHQKIERAYRRAKREADNAMARVVKWETKLKYYERKAKANAQS